LLRDDLRNVDDLLFDLWHWHFDQLLHLPVLDALLDDHLPRIVRLCMCFSCTQIIQNIYIIIYTYIQHVHENERMIKDDSLMIL